MDDGEWLARRFEENRPHLRAVAYRMLGTLNEADEAVEEAWMQIVDGGDPSDEGVRGLPAWLMTVVANVSLDRLRSRRTVSSEPVAPLGARVPAARRAPDDLADPVPRELAAELAVMGQVHEEMLADSVGLALLVVLEALDPAERMAFVLHDLFGLPYDEIAPIVGVDEARTRELAELARRRVRSVDPLPDEGNRLRRLVDAFLTASRGGDFESLIAMLDPDVVLYADPEAVAVGAPTEVRGASSVAKTFSGRARYAQLALVDGTVGAVWAPRGQPRVVFGFTVVDERITGIDMRAAPERIGALDLTILGGPEAS
ncbi:sigma-70 family RNA polymerase sigma factor [Streptomyces sp. NPDC059070]|uniref:sigma-70 family RNA polymerase sigma factor n=1 Tax=unclassified Streptomyces TaxID=2593676 RepID=UPI0034E2870C